MDLFRLDGKVAVVTGGSRGIGKAIALGLGRAGADVVIASRNEEECRRVADEVCAMGRKALAAKCDVSAPADVATLFDRVASSCGGTDVLVCCAGLSSVARAEDVSRVELQRMLDVHFLGAMEASQRAFAQMKSRDGGSIVVVGSIWGLGAQPLSIAYGCAKAALHHAVKVMAVEWAPFAVRVNGLAPGYVDTDMTAEIDATVRDKFLKRVPMRRMATPSEMVGPAVFLSSSGSSYVTGQVLVADGGQRAR